MAEFTLTGFPLLFAVVFGIALFSMNFSLLFVDGTDLDFWQWLLIGISILIYFWVLYKTIREPISDLVPLTREELEDHEYDRIVIQSKDDPSNAGGSRQKELV